MVRLDEKLTEKLANNTLTILLARAMAIFGPVAAGYLFITSIGSLDNNMKLLQSEMRKLEQAVSDINKTTAVNSVNIVVHEKRLESLDTRVTYIERVRP